MEKVRFDFGCKTAEAGYIKITTDSLFNAEKGYGITEAAEATERKTGVKPVCRDFLLLGNKGFKVNVENGLYNIRVYAGDYEDNGDVTTRTFINGKRYGLWVNDSTVSEAVFKVEVTEGVIDFTFEGKYVCINAIDIAPVLKEVIGQVDTDITATGEENSVHMCWKSLDCAVAYRIYRKNLKNNLIDSIVDVNKNEYKDSTVELCGKYEYLVKGLDNFGFETDDSKPFLVEVINGEALGKAPAGLAVEATENSVSLKWDTISDAVDYNVYQKAPHGLYKKIATVKNTEYTHKEVKTVVSFVYAVDARTPAGITKKAEIAAPVKAPTLKRKMETLDRGLVAIKSSEGIFLSWRLNAYEYGKGINFHLYRNGSRITEEPITNSTNYLDKDGTVSDSYTVKAVKDGKVEKDGYTTNVIDGEYLPIAIDKPAPYTTPDGRVVEYTANDISVADLDGDGEYEIVLKWDAGSKDNSHTGYTGIVYLDAYKLSGKKLWRIDLGVNIRAGAHYTQFMVYDFDGDGKAELVCKTADGTIDGKGNIIGDKNADYRNKDGFILEGPEFLTLFNGETGEILDTVDYDQARGNVSEWGDSWGNRVDRFLAAVAYLDGENPSVVMCRGYYDHGRPTVLVSYDVVDKKLKKRWKFLANKEQNIEYTNQGNHSISVGDIDGDGLDEIVYGACAIDHDGTGIYSTGLEHGDAMHLGKFSPKTPNLDFYQIHEHASAKYGFGLRNSATGEFYFGKYTGRDTGRGLIANIDPRYEGCEFWAAGDGLYTFDGKLIAEKGPSSINFAIWWDGDLTRELLDHKWQGGDIKYGIGQISKWDYEKQELKVILDTRDAYSNNGTKGNPCIQADIFGDWREEVIWRNEDSTELRVYTTTHLTEHKFYTLMHDPVYRLSVAWQNTAYNQPPHTGFYIGDTMEMPPVPNNVYVRGENLPQFIEDEE